MTTTTTMTTESLPTISDTARWVAVYRADESERPDALFRDPFARRLAGERGRAIVQSFPKRVRQSWPIVARTVAIDDLVLRSVAEGFDRVLNLAAGLDTRPYRLDLPPGLTWIEADLPAIVDEKERALADETPRCRLLREKVDLADRAARSAFLDRALDGARRALVITEGLVIYLHPAQVEELGRDFAARPEIGAWMLDVTSPAILRMMQKSTGAHLGEDAQMHFGPANGVAFFGPLGWTPRDVRSLFVEAGRLRRLPPLLRLFSFLPDAKADAPGNRPWSAVVRLVPGRR